MIDVRFVYADVGAGHMPNHVGDDLLDLVGKRAAVGVAQHDPAGACLVGVLGDAQGVLAIGLVAVEEVLAVDHRLAAGGDDRLDGLANAFQVFLVGRAECDADVIVPGLGDETGSRGWVLQRVLKARVVGDRAAGALGHAERRESRVRERRGRCKKLGVGLIGPWVATLDVVDAQLIEDLGDPDLVGDREVEARGLGAVPECRVEQVEAFLRGC
jgi:hypothetical protein